MTKILMILLMVSAPAGADEYVSGYTKRDGTYVPGHHRSSGNNTKDDNYSTKGNTNPYTGKMGHGDRESDTYSKPYKYDSGKEYRPGDRYKR